MADPTRDIELRFVIRTDMPDFKLDEFVTWSEAEVAYHLLDDEKVVSSLWTEKVSYESKQSIKERGND